MSTSTARPAVNVGPAEAHPALALLFGILSVPGSTLGWDLPGGGLYIGLPLAIAAIVLGLRARRARVGVVMASIGMVLAALSILQMVVWTTVSAVS